MRPALRSGARIAAHTIGAAGIRRHRETYKAQFSLVVARGFDGEDDAGSAANSEAKTHAITLMTIEDFARLVLAAATRQLGFSLLRELFETCRTPAQAKAWIDNLIAKKPDPGPLPDILDAIWKLQKESLDPVRFAAVTQAKKLKGKYRNKEVADWMQSARRLAGGYISIDGDVVALEAPPEKVLRQLHVQIRKLPADFRDASVDDDEN